MRLMAIGFPKSGTTSLTKALNQSGIKSAHWRTGAGLFVGQEIYRAIYKGLDPFALLPNFQAVTQADVCVPDLKLNYWPNLDFSLLSAIRRVHPECLFLLNYRNPEAIADSIIKWEDLQKRLVVSDIPGLPRGIGGQRQHLVTWVENHFDACRNIFAKDERFLELDIEAPDVADRLGKALDTTIIGWGDYKAKTLKDELTQMGRADLGPDLVDIRKPWG